MRNCPVCNGEYRKDIALYWGSMTLYECQCGMWYLDSRGLDQDTLDRYYSSMDTSPDLQDANSLERLMLLAMQVQSYGKKKRVLDIGGKFSPLKTLLPTIETLNAGEEMQGMYDVIVLSHTLEHVYDVPGLMVNITGHLTPRGRLLVEGPYWPDHCDINYDAHWQHVNKFRVEDYQKLFHNSGFQASMTILPQFLDYYCVRVEGVRL